MIPAAFAVLSLAGIAMGPAPAAARAAALAQSAGAEAPPAAGAPRVGRITVEVVDVFDPEAPGENRLFHRIVNALHIQTQEEVIRRELLFEEGDLLDEEILAETERNLRRLPFLRGAQVTHRTGADGLAEVHVRAQDNWTTRASVSFGRSGGNNRGGASAQEKNLLGLGKRVEFGYESDLDRSRNTLGYEDPRLFGSRLHLKASHHDSSDGEGDFFSLLRPFYSLDTRWTAGGLAERNLEASRIYSGGEEIAEFDKRAETGRLFYGWSRGRGGPVVRRFTAGWLYNRSRYEPAGRLRAGYPEEQVPADRRVNAPFFTFRFETSRWIEAKNLVRMERVEDHNLGTVFELQTALNLRSLGGSADEVLLDGIVERGFRTGPHGLLFLRGLLDARYGAPNAETLASFETVLYDTRFPRQTLAGRLRYDHGIGLDASNRLLLGGDEGLRGFDSRLLDGNRRFLLNLEDRFHTRIEVFRLFFLGAAVFVDAGNAWGSPGTDGFGQIHADAGVGLRFDASRASQGGLLRLDVAFPFSGDRRDGPSVQFSFGSGLGF